MSLVSCNALGSELRVLEPFLRSCKLFSCSKLTRFFCIPKFYYRVLSPYPEPDESSPSLPLRSILILSAECRLSEAKYSNISKGI
jgi:hypothetical protein